MISTAMISIAMISSAMISTTQLQMISFPQSPPIIIYHHERTPKRSTKNRASRVVQGERQWFFQGQIVCEVPQSLPSGSSLCLWARRQIISNGNVLRTGAHHRSIKRKDKSAQIFAVDEHVSDLHVPVKIWESSLSVFFC